LINSEKNYSALLLRGLPQKSIFARWICLVSRVSDFVDLSSVVIIPLP